MTTSFDVNYPQNPWADIANKTRDYYVPDLYRIYQGQTVYNRFVSAEFNMNGLGATQMFIDQPLMPHADTDTVSAREVWLDAAYMGSQRRVITFERHAGKLAFHKYDNAITYWKQDGVRGLSRIIDMGLGYQITWVMEKLARNAFLSNSFAMFGQGTGVDFGDITTSDTITSQVLRDMWLGLKERGVPYADTASFETPGSVFCITSPGVVSDLQREASGTGAQNQFVDVMRYADPNRLIRNEVGMYHGVRFLESNLACLYNAGPITVQTTIAAAVNAGDGAPNPSTTAVDGTYYVGESTATHYITVADETGFSVGDIVTVHVLRTSANGVTNGVNYTDGKLSNRRIVAIDTGNNRISFDLPIMVDLTTDLGGGVYGYVTKGSNIHSALFVTNNDGVVNGILQAPQLYTPPPVDDVNGIYRFSWDFYSKFQVFNPQAFEVWFGAGSNRVKGPRYIR